VSAKFNNIFYYRNKMSKEKIIEETDSQKAIKKKLVITDVDGVLTDTGVYITAKGEELKTLLNPRRHGHGTFEKLLMLNGKMTRETTEIVNKSREKIKYRRIISRRTRKRKNF
jgi:3-deoxy-D-manno-octulosonate 8-phosphate phosphatase KdsC-like HAD superfamily phosphatase